MDAPLIQIGAGFTKDSAKNLGDLIGKVFADGRRTGMDQETIRLALGIVGRATQVEGTSINGCNLTGEDNHS